jgi:hypothetical protein
VRDRQDALRLQSGGKQYLIIMLTSQLQIEGGAHVHNHRACSTHVLNIDNVGVEVQVEVEGEVVRHHSKTLNDFATILQIR